MLSHVCLPFALALNTLRMFMNNLYVCPFIITELLQKSQFEHLPFSQMTLREISGLSRISPFKTKTDDTVHY